VSHAFRLKVESSGVTVAEWVVLRALFDADGVNPSQLADTIGLTRGAVSKLVDRLESKGLARCELEKADRRYQTVRITPTGRRLVPKLATLADRNDLAFFGHLSAAEQKALAATLKDIVFRHGLKQTPVD
jgi:DNA-binding MarR family transcriptional regulator